MRRLPIAILLAACGGAGDDWTSLQQDEPASLLAVWGADAADVWVVGGRATLDGEPTVLHYDGDEWSRVASGAAGVDLWWVFGFPGGDVFFSGSEGAILRYRDGVFGRMETPRSGIIFGMWGASPDDLWAVGDGGDDGGIVWHYDGVAWSEVALPEGVPSRVFKVHGQRADDVWMSCADGLTLHWDGVALEPVGSGETAPLFSVVTVPGTAVAVGGADDQGVLLENTGSAWIAADLLAPVAWRGAAAGAETIYAVGEFGAVARRDAGGWETIDQPLVGDLDFHAAWVDPAGGLWAVGGDFERIPLTSSGFLLYHGNETISEVRE